MYNLHVIQDIQNTCIHHISIIKSHHFSSCEYTYIAKTLCNSLPVRTSQEAHIAAHLVFYGMMMTIIMMAMEIACTNSLQNF